MFLKKCHIKNFLSFANKNYFSSMNDNIISHLEERSLISNLSHPNLLSGTDNISSVIGKNSRIYIGFDPTAEALHLGNLMGIITAIRFSLYGIDPVFVVGGATGMVGDPSGKIKERKLLSTDTIEKNIISLKENIHSLTKNVTSGHNFKSLLLKKKDLIQASKSSDDESFNDALNRDEHLLLMDKFRKESKMNQKMGNQKQDQSIHPFLAIQAKSTEESNKSDSLINYLIVNNHDFYKDLSVIDYLRNVGIHMRMGPMLRKENVATRLNTEEGMSLTEFLYQTMQGYDFLKLYDKYNVRIQIGGSDQWGNMMSGNDLIRKVRNSEVLSLTFPLLTTPTGEKFGKSEGNALFVKPQLTSPNKIYQYFYNSHDSEIEKLLNTFTFLERDQITDILKFHNQNIELREGQKILAKNVVELLYSEDEVKRCENNSKVFSFNLKDSNKEEIHKMIQSCEKISISQDLFEKATISKICADFNICKNRAEGKRMIEKGAIKINDSKISDDILLNKNMLIDGKYILVKTGKKNINILSLD